MSFEGNTWLTYVIFSLIVVLSFFGNILVLYVLVTRPSYLKHPYNIFIFSLAVTDVVTVFFLVFSRFLFLPPVPDGNQISREIFCRTIWSALVLFDLFYISLYTAVVLTVERWLAVVKPLVYRSMKPHHAVKAVVFVWVWGILINLTTVFRAKFNEAKQKCTWTSLNVANDELSWFDFTLQTLIPFFVITFLYSHILYTMRNNSNIGLSRRQSIKRATVVAFTASSAMVCATVPSRVTFMLSKVGIVDPNGLLHFSLVTLSLCNSFFNPILYGIYSSQFRSEYKVIFWNLYGKCQRKQVTMISVHPLPISNTSNF